ncbi:hypothetical protein WOSG25_021710 [Weissella oryzae SG25]|uniref:Nucleoid-associated protein n=1 Tax=Weissella oryzae (strain DSM 25784 / JCM 18191 / LMG 30913 / SG25) TaxID=1329250 RepID=A0A069CSD4_WEIOS|nr:nucleoid-associated protein [Weissella oryzae]GAK30374.1 hypothetical protein WOSG25_021710 [Weissella oryzae SG25]
MIIKHAILHILDKDAGHLVTSQGELNLTQSGVHEYLEKLLEKLNQGDVKSGQLQADDFLSAYVDNNNTQTFAEKTGQLAEKLFETIAAAEEVPAGDMLSLEYSEGQDDFFALLKLNFAPRYAHNVEYEDDMMVNKLVLNQAVLPAASQRPDEGIVVNLMTGDYVLIEKNYLIDGHRVNNFSKRFLELEPANSNKVQLTELKKVIKTVADKYDLPLHEAYANTQEGVFEQISEGETINIKEISHKVFKENIAAQTDFQQVANDKELDQEIILANPMKYEKKFAIQRFKLDSGIEISIPTNIFHDKRKVEIINNPDGSLSLLVKDIESIMNTFNG